jgi:hypothetical protein
MNKQSITNVTSIGNTGNMDITATGISLNGTIGTTNQLFTIGSSGPTWSDMNVFYPDLSNVLHKGNIAGSTGIDMNQQSITNVTSIGNTGNMDISANTISLNGDTGTNGWVFTSGGSQNPYWTELSSSLIYYSNTDNIFLAENGQTGGYLSGTNNTAIGSGALAGNTGNNNTAIGSGALAGNTSGANNIAIGFQAGSTNTGTGNILIGANTVNTTDSDQIIIGNTTNKDATIYSNTLTLKNNSDETVGSILDSNVVGSATGCLNIATVHFGYNTVPTLSDNQLGYTYSVTSSDQPFYKCESSVLYYYDDSGISGSTADFDLKITTLTPGVYLVCFNVTIVTEPGNTISYLSTSLNANGSYYAGVTNDTITVLTGYYSQSSSVVITISIESSIMVNFDLDNGSDNDTNVYSSLISASSTYPPTYLTATRIA